MPIPPDDADAAAAAQPEGASVVGPPSPGDASSAPSSGRRERPTRRRRWRRVLLIVLAAAAVVAALAVVVAVVVLHRAQPAQPGAFYTAPAPLPEGPPGTIIRTEPIHGFPHSARAWRVLYKSTSYDGRPTAVSGMVVVPDSAAPAGGRNVLAYAHGTVGVAPNCAPSLLGAKFVPWVAGIAQFIAAGDVIAMTDYQGLGTPGPHPYLVGRSEAIGVLDSVRAAHNLAEAQAGTTFAVWGESQGGHASLFTGELAASYAPELKLVGVAAAEPATDLRELFRIGAGTTFGDVLAAYALRAWEQVYEAPSLEQVVTPAARPVVRQVNRYCIQNTKQQLAVLPAATILKLTFLSQPPWDTEPWKTVAQQNTPGAASPDAPLFITQGDADKIVSPAVTAAFVQRLCDQGETVAFHSYPGEGHITTPAVSVPDLVPWVADRFAGKPAPSTCAAR